MKHRLLGLLAVFSLGVVCWSAPNVSDSIKTIRAVGSEGQGNAAAAQALKKLAQADAAAIPAILNAMNGANPLAANWLRAAVDTIAAREKKLPLKGLNQFLANKANNPRARRLAFELIQGTAPDAAEKLIPTMLNDPSVELRRDAVQRVIVTAMELQNNKKDKLAAGEYRKACRDV